MRLPISVWVCMLIIYVYTTCGKPTRLRSTGRFLAAFLDVAVLPSSKLLDCVPADQHSIVGRRTWWMTRRQIHWISADDSLSAWDQASCIFKNRFRCGTSTQKKKERKKKEKKDECNELEKPISENLYKSLVRLLVRLAFSRDILILQGSQLVHDRCCKVDKREADLQNSSDLRNTLVSCCRAALWTSLIASTQHDQELPVVLWL